jgi:HNH endonuclease/NUMOD4 motif
VANQNYNGNETKIVHPGGVVELWRDVPGQEGEYRVSNLGRLRSLPRTIVTKRRVVKPFKGGLCNYKPHKSLGYVFTKIGLMHRLVLEAFVGPCPRGMQCCHKDGNRANNKLENLRWDTQKKNEQDKKCHGTYGKGGIQRGENN